MYDKKREIRKRVNDHRCHQCYNDNGHIRHAHTILPPFCHHTKIRIKPNKNKKYLVNAKCFGISMARNSCFQVPNLYVYI